jgi:hypothetical protein
MNVGKEEIQARRKKAQEAAKEAKKAAKEVARAAKREGKHQEHAATKAGKKTKKLADEDATPAKAEVKKVGVPNHERDLWLHAHVKRRNPWILVSKVGLPWKPPRSVVEESRERRRKVRREYTESMKHRSLSPKDRKRPSDGKSSPKSQTLRPRVVNPMQTPKHLRSRP